MSIKDLFEKQKENSISLKGFTKSTIDQFSNEVESADYVEQKQIYAQTFIPDLDYSTASNFIKFGSAEKYYENSINRITSEYPYDGSKSEKLEFYNSLNPLEKYIIDNEYPRTTGYVNFAPNGWGAKASSKSGIGLPSTIEYISFYNQSINNVYDPVNGRRENTRLIFTSGSTVEFWMKKNSFVSSASSSYECIFYMSSTGSNNKESSFSIQISPLATSTVYAYYYTNQNNVSINQEFGFSYDTNLNTIADSTWHHYTFTFYSGSTGYASDFYLDGIYKNTQTNTNSIVDFSGSAFCTLGALGGQFVNYGTPIGSAKLSGSIDEFRFWNTKRDAKQIGVNYFTQVGGGTNTDLANVNLGVYYKFNEGITTNNSTDSVILDYAGRVCNGTFTGYNSLSRSTGSAINIATTSVEPTDPIIYTNHPDVISYSAAKALSGSFYDANNASSLMNSIPRWILDEDQGDVATNFLQILASYLDTLYLQISNLNKLKNLSYHHNDSVKQNPFNNKLLTSLGFDAPDLFINSDILKSIFDQDDKRLFEEKISDIKNQIYKNIYNNLTFINKSKGTEKAFRNLIRCFGADDDLFKLTIYANNSEYKFQDKYTNVGVKKAYLDMTEVIEQQNSEAVVYQYPESGTPNSANTQGFIAGNSNYNIGATLETEIVFPKLVATYNNPLLSPPSTFTSQSLFGIHKADAANPSDTTYFSAATDYANIQVYSVTRDDVTKFVITSSLGLYGETDVIKNVYNDSRWNLSFRLRPTKYPFVSGAFAASSFTAEFHGYNYDSGELVNSFTSSFVVNTSSANNFQLSAKRIYAGAHRQNMTGSLLTPTNIKLLSVRYWSDYLKDDELQIHARDVSNYGRDNPFENAFVYENGQQGSVYIPKIDTLSMYWDFETLSTSSAAGIISIIPDVKSASINDVKYPTAFNNLVGYQHTGKGSFFANSFQVKNNEYYNSSKIQIPENVDSSDLIQILETDDDRNASDNLPQSMFFSVESSMYDVISRKALEFFSTIVDFNNLIGEPTNAYKINYSDLVKLRQLFFENVENSPDLDKYVGLYKWVDDALEGVLNNLIPASANASDKVRTIVENHILERSKYRFPFIPSGSLPNVVQNNGLGTNGQGNKGGGAAVSPADPPYFAEDANSYIGSNTDVIDVVAGVLTPIPPMPAPWTKLRTNAKSRDYIEIQYVNRTYHLPPSAERQTIGFEPNVLFRYNRTDTNLISSTVDSGSQENLRKIGLNVPKLDATKAIKFANNGVTITTNANSLGSLSNTALLFSKTILNTTDANVKIILTPDSKQVFLSDSNISQQVDLSQENKS
jgi:hypothetical protein